MRISRTQYLNILAFLGSLIVKVLLLLTNVNSVTYSLNKKFTFQNTIVFTFTTSHRLLNCCFFYIGLYWNAI